MATETYTLEESLTRGQAASAVFCSRCGSMLTLPESGAVACDDCHATYQLSELADVEVVTTGRKRPPPQWLAEFLEDERRKSMPEGAKEDEGPRRATVEEECPKCKHPTMHYWTMQMRSADEGQTVFFECPKCKYLYSTNT